MKTILFVLCLFLVGLNSQAQSTNSGSAANLDTNKPAARAEANDKEVAVLHAQLDFMKDYDGRLLTTVYMALGGTFLMWTLINIAAYLTNRQDKKALLKEIQDKTAAETTRLNGEITVKAQALDEKLASGLAASKKELEQLVETKAKDVTDTLSAQINGLNNSLAANLKNLRKELSEVDYKFAAIEAQNWLAQKVHKNVLREYQEMLSISITNEMPWRISKDLEKIQELVKVIPNDGILKLDADEVRELEKLLAKAPKDHETVINAIRKLLLKFVG